MSSLIIIHKEGRDQGSLGGQRVLSAFVKERFLNSTCKKLPNEYKIQSISQLSGKINLKGGKKEGRKILHD